MFDRECRSLQRVLIISIFLGDVDNRPLENSHSLRKKITDCNLPIVGRACVLLFERSFSFAAMLNSLLHELTYVYNLSVLVVCYLGNPL